MLRFSISIVVAILFSFAILNANSLHDDEVQKATDETMVSSQTGPAEGDVTWDLGIEVPGQAGNNMMRTTRHYFDRDTGRVTEKKPQ